ncbi:DNA transformation protein [Nitrosomonas marina]|uniref:DNA transformation protein n=1 Tax=Nitrosomonas marina TaxID=917 RepID=A0A1I0C841_9PROT|nr:DNA transformation protein [Nitrosomonas marina]
MPISDLENLRNIGKVVANRLRGVGIYTRADLEKRGAAATYLAIRDANPGAILPRCYYLYSLEGALRDVHWDALPEEVKRALSIEAGIE